MLNGELKMENGKLKFEVTSKNDKMNNATKTLNL